MVVLMVLACACLPLAFIAVIGGRAGRLAAALVFIAVLFVMTVLAGFAVFTSDLGTWPYSAAICVGGAAAGAFVARRLMEAARDEPPRGRASPSASPRR